MNAMMRSLSLRAACLLLAGACCTGSAWGQRPRTGHGPPRANPPPRSQEIRDPTQPSPEVREAIEASQAVPEETGTRGGAPPPAALPHVRLKARLVGSFARPVAILEIDGQAFTVYTDSETTVASKAGGATTLIVRKITASEVQIELPALKKLLIFH